MGSDVHTPQGVRTTWHIVHACIVQGVHQTAHEGRGWLCPPYGKACLSSLGWRSCLQATLSNAKECNQTHAPAAQKPLTLASHSHSHHCNTSCQCPRTLNYSKLQRLTCASWTLTTRSQNSQAVPGACRPKHSLKCAPHHTTTKNTTAAGTLKCAASTLSVQHDYMHDRTQATLQHELTATSTHTSQILPVPSVQPRERCSAAQAALLSHTPRALTYSGRTAAACGSQIYLAAHSQSALLRHTPARIQVPHSCQPLSPTLTQLPTTLRKLPTTPTGLPQKQQ